MWKRPGRSPMTSTRLSTEFNQTVQFDLLFVEDYIICHMIDEATRWTSAWLVRSRRASDILSSITRNWIRIFGAPQVFISDKEGAVDSEKGSIFFERWNIQPHLKPKGSHANIVERHHELLRQQIHKISSQLRHENLSVDFEEI
jgi:hypothetical protein